MTQSRTFPIPGEPTLVAETKTTLQQVGAALDERRQIRVYVHGMIAVDQQPPLEPTTKENDDDRQRQRGSKTRSGKGTTRREGPPRGSRQAGAASRVVVDELGETYERQVTCLAEAYPGLQTFPDPNGMWLLAKSGILPGLTREATFLVALPYQRGLGPRAWGFWTTLRRSVWIGPRHTNFQDGSICAFSPDDRVWVDGGDLTTLLDLYSVWALRHLHLEVFNRWPGKQYGLFGVDARAQAYYRLTQCKDDEFCGCGSETLRYCECCKPLDLQQDFTQLLSHFMSQISGGFESRRPPLPVVNFIDGKAKLPKMTEVHSLLVSLTGRS